MPEPPEIPRLPPSQPAEPALAEFLARRLEAAEGELASERRRAQAAESLLAQQEALRDEVERQLKTLSEQLRREKTERDSQETLAHAQGRIGSLERRLDEMHQTWAGLLKEAVAGAPRGASPEGLERLLASALEEAFGRWERAWKLEAESHRARVDAFVKERAALLEAVDERQRSLAQELARERAAQERRGAERLDQISALVDKIARDQAASLERDRDLRQAIDRQARPQTRDAIIAGLEAEREKLLQDLAERSESLRKFAEERRAAEARLEESLERLSSELSREREKAAGAPVRIRELELELAARGDDLAALRRQLAQAQAERDRASALLAADAAKTQEREEARRRSEEGWAARVRELEARLEAEAQARLAQAHAASDLKTQLGAVSQALREKEQALARNGDTEALKAALAQKEEMIALLSSTFRKLVTD